jgi:hypothetical protein
VRYAATVAVPRDREMSGWMSYDLRDTQRFGPNNPNPAPYDRFASLAYCRGNVFFCTTQTQSIDLTFTRPIQFGVLARAQLLYDIRGAGATLFINGTRVGVMPPAATVEGASGEEWVHRSIDVPVALLRQGTNDLRIELDGVVQLDRLQMEFGYERAAKRRAAR